MGEQQPEFELVRACARTHLDDEARHDIARLIPQGLDWEQVLRLGKYHSVLPLLHRSLASTAIPQDVRAVLTRRYFRTGARNLMLKKEIGGLTRLLAEHQVEAIFFKGTVLAQMAYGSLGLRSCNDIDLLVLPEALEVIKPLLLQGPYRLFRRLEGLTRRQKAVEIYISRQFAFMHENQFALDVHLGLMPPGYYFPLSFQTLLDRSEHVMVVDTPVRSFGAEDLLLILCYQGVKNKWKRLKHICDITELVRTQEELDWDAVWRRAQAMKGQRILSLGLYLAHSLLRMPLPGEVERSMRQEGGVRHLGVQLAERLSMPSQHSPDTYREGLRFYLKVQPSPGTKLRYVAYSLFRKIRNSNQATKNK